MSMSWNSTFRKGWGAISCHNPLVLDVELVNANASQISGDVYVDIQGQGNAENQTLYTFDMAYYGTTGSSPTYTHRFILNITDIIKKICNDPRYNRDTSGATYWENENRLFTLIYITAKSSGESNITQNNYYAHGFNKINTNDYSCLVEFCNKDVVATIPVVPGVPMVFSLWNEVPEPTNSHKFALADEGGTDLNSRTVSAPFTQGLLQFYDNVRVNQELYDEYEKPETFSLRFEDTTTSTVKQKLYLAAWKKACEGDVVLAWLNRYGIYSFMAFERHAIHKTDQQSLGNYDLEVISIGELQSRKASRGFENVQTTISAVAKSVPTAYFPFIEDLFYSMDVYYFTGTLPEYEFDAQEWLRVEVRGTLMERKKYNHENVRVDILLPEKYTQVR